MRQALVTSTMSSGRGKREMCVYCTQTSDIRETNSLPHDLHRGNMDADTEWLLHYFTLEGYFKNEIFTF
jgi:hypothetical protein